MGILLPKYSQRKGRPMSRSKNYVVQQLQAGRPLQPKISSQDGVLKKRLPPIQSTGVVTAGHASRTTTIITVAPPPTTTVELKPPLQFIGLNGSTVICENAPGAIPQISIPSPAYEAEAHHVVEDQDEEDEDEVEDGVNDSFSLSFLDENSRTDMESGNRNITSTPAHLQVDDHFLDSVLENSSNSLLQTPRRSSPPPSPPGGLSEHSWLPELSLTSFFGSLPSSSASAAESRMMLAHHEDSIQSTASEVDRQLTMMLNENSLDFSSKFAHLASALNSTD